MEVALSQYPVLQGVVPHISTEDLFYLSCVGENAEETCLKELQRRRKNTPTSVYYSGLIDTEFLNLQPCDELTVTLPVASSEIDYRVLFRSVRNWQTPRVMRVIIAGRVPSRLQRFLRPRFLPWTDLIIPVSQVFKIRDNFTRLTTLALTSTRNRRISLPNLNAVRRLVRDNNLIGLSIPSWLARRIYFDIQMKTSITQLHITDDGITPLDDRLRVLVTMQRLCKLSLGCVLSNSVDVCQLSQVEELSLKYFSRSLDEIISLTRLKILTLINPRIIQSHLVSASQIEVLQLLFENVMYAVSSPKLPALDNVFPKLKKIRMPRRVSPAAIDCLITNNLHCIFNLTCDWSLRTQHIVPIISKLATVKSLSVLNVRVKQADIARFIDCVKQLQKLDLLIVSGFNENELRDLAGQVPFKVVHRHFFTNEVLNPNF